MRVKICGLRSRADIAAAVGAGAYYGGFVFCARSVRNLTLADARWVAEDIPTDFCAVGLTVDATDAEIDAILKALPLDMLQLHGSETPDRVASLRATFGLPVIKAVGVADGDDLARIDEFTSVADQILVDARAPDAAPAPGGNGIAFDWTLLDRHKWRRPWMLAGGLTVENVGDAIARTGAVQVDVSSGVERAPGIKDPARISAFVQAASGRIDRDQPGAA